MAALSRFQFISFSIPSTLSLSLSLSFNLQSSISNFHLPSSPMQSVNILNYLENKTILVTGSTGFLGKIFVEKILRVQPDVKKLFLLARPSTEKTAEERLQVDVFGKDLFDVLKQKHGDGFDGFVREKIQAVSGDVTDEDLGIVDASLMGRMLSQIDVVVNIAATTKFDERYDVALEINTLGTKHVIDFSKKCANLRMLLHVSTAYVAGEKSGLIPEEPYLMGEALNGEPGLDIDAEIRVARERVSELRAEGVKKAEERIAMKKLGIQRARKYGWPNTYVFTKSMGEMIVGQHRGELPVAIMRPTIITSTFKEPFPGWVEGTRTIDSFISAFAKGNLSFMLADPILTMDVIPGDMVVNAMLGIMASHVNGRSEFIYHVGSSSSNPVNVGLLEESAYKVLCLIKGKRKIKRARFCTTKEQFDFHMRLSYKLPLEVLRVVDVAFFKLFRDKYVKLNKKYKYMMRLVDLYEPYALFKGIFEDKNIGGLLSKIGKGSQQEMFDFNVKTIDWKNYFMSVHIPGVLKYMEK